MIVVRAVIGNISEHDWQARLAGASLDWLLLDQWEAQRTRFRKRTQDGLELAVTLERGAQLRDGDILFWDEHAGHAVAARIDLKAVMVIDLSGLLSREPDTALRTAVELGHALGNQHWPAVVKGAQVFVPLTVDRTVMASVMNTHAFQDIRYEFIPGSEVIPYLAPHEARRVFGGAEGLVHSHLHEAEHGPGHANPHDAEHGEHVHER